MISVLAFKARVGSALFDLQRPMQCTFPVMYSTSGATPCQPLDGQHCGATISDDDPALPPISALPKPYNLESNADCIHNSAFR